MKFIKHVFQKIVLVYRFVGEAPNEGHGPESLLFLGWLTFIAANLILITAALALLVTFLIWLGGVLFGYVSVGAVIVGLFTVLLAAGSWYFVHQALEYNKKDYNN